MFELFVKLLTHSATSAMSAAVTSIYGVIVLLPIIYLNYKRPWFQALLFITAAGSVVAAVQHVLDVVQVRQERSAQADQAKKSQQEAIGLLKELQEKADRYTANKDKSVKVSAGLSIKGKRVSSHASQKWPQKRVKSSKKRNKKLKKGDKLGNALQKLGKKIEDRDKKDRRSKLISWIWWGVKKVIIIAAIVFIIYWLLSYRLSLTKNRGHGGTLSFAQKHIDQKGNIRGNQPRQQEADDGLGLSSPEGLLEKRENPHPVAKNQKNAFLNPKVKEVQTCSTILDADNLSLLAIAWRIDQSNLPRFVWAHQTLERGIQKGEFSEKDLSLFYEKKGDLLLPNEKMEQVEAEGEVINNGDKIRSIQDYRREEEYKRKAKARRKQFEDRLHQRRRKREQKSVKESKISEKERRDKAKERLFDRKRRLEEMKKREKLEAEICKKKKEEHKKRSEKIQKRKEKEQKKRKRQHQKKHKEALKRRLEYSFNPNKRAALSFFNDEKEREEAEEGLGDLRIQEDELLKLLKELVHKKDGLISNRSYPIFLHTRIGTLSPFRLIF